MWLHESTCYWFGFGFEHVSEIETTTSYHSNNGKDLHKEANGSVSSPSNTNVNPEGSSWAFNQPSLDNGNEKEVLYLTIHSQRFRLSIIYGFYFANTFSAGFEMKRFDFW